MLNKHQRKQKYLNSKNYKKLRDQRYETLETSEFYKEQRLKETKEFENSHKRRKLKSEKLSSTQLNGFKGNRSKSGKKNYGGKLQTLSGWISKDYSRELRENKIIMS